MKNLILTLILLVLFNNLISCSVNDNDAKVFYLENGKKYSSFKNLYQENKSYFEDLSRFEYANLPNELRKIVFEEINPEKSYNFWIQKFNQAIESGFYKESKNEYIKVIISNFSPSLFNPNNQDERIAFTEKTFNDLKRLKFSDKEIYLLLYTLHDISKEGEVLNVDSNFYYSFEKLVAPKDSDCKIWSCYVPIACANNGCDTDCEPTDNCGPWGGWECDGKCDIL